MSVRTEDDAWRRGEADPEQTPGGGARGRTRDSGAQ